MIKLIDLIREAKSIGILYHSTGGENLISILRSDNLKTSNSFFGDQVSFTRDKDYRPGAYTIEVDGTKLSNSYRVDPFVYRIGGSTGGTRGEAEEVVKQDITDIKKYITNIYANVEIVEERPYKELESILKLYPGLKFTIGGNVGHVNHAERSEVVREIPKQEALTYIKYNRY
jgi:hypothetical protein